MDFKQFVLVVFWSILLNELCFISTTTTTTFVAAMSIANQDLERYFRTKNVSQTLTVMTEERIALDMYTYAYLNYSYLNDQHQLIDMTFSEEKARYGEGKVFNIRGRLVHITDVTDSEALSSSSASASGAAVVGILDGGDYACTPNILGTRGSPTPPTGVKWIALVRRGRCTFEEKVMHVHAKGASGVIIYNDKPVSNLEKMQIKGKSRNITAVITYQDIGQDMARIVDQGVDVMAAIIEGRSGMRPLNTMNRTSVLFVSISFIVLMIISLVWLVFYYIQRFRYLQSKDQQSRHLCSVTKKAIMKIPTKTGKTSDEKDLDSDCCAICIEAYKTSDCIRVLPCKHEFHKNCIDPWLIEHRTCPMCKLDVLKFYGYVVGDQLTSSPNLILHNQPSSPAISSHFNNAMTDVQVVSVHAVISSNNAIITDTTTAVITTTTTTTTTQTQTHSQAQTQTPEPEPDPDSLMNSSHRRSSDHHESDRDRYRSSQNCSNCQSANNSNNNNNSNSNSWTSRNSGSSLSSRNSSSISCNNSSSSSGQNSSNNINNNSNNNSINNNNNNTSHSQNNAIVDIGRRDSTTTHVVTASRQVTDV